MILVLWWQAMNYVGLQLGHIVVGYLVFLIPWSCIYLFAANIGFCLQGDNLIENQLQCGFLLVGRDVAQSEAFWVPLTCLLT